VDRSQKREHVIIPLAPRTGRSLDLYIGERTTGPIFVGAKGGRMDRYAADRMVKRLSKRAGVNKRISPHSLRHSFITAALDAGVPLRDGQEAASHADPRTTMRYDRARQSLDRHATYIVAAFVAGAARVSCADAGRYRAPVSPLRAGSATRHRAVGPGIMGWRSGARRPISSAESAQSPSSFRAGNLGGSGVRRGV
jgi:Phage integrase family